MPVFSFPPQETTPCSIKLEVNYLGKDKYHFMAVVYRFKSCQKDKYHFMAEVYRFKSCQN